MKTKLFLFTIFFTSLVFTGFSIENSIVEKIEHFEKIENIPNEKYSKTQLAEIQTALENKGERIRLMTYNMLFNLYDHNLE